MMKLAIVAAIVAFYTWGAVSASRAIPTQALCSTDSDCMKLCPAKDESCDGGPQS